MCSPIDFSGACGITHRHDKANGEAQLKAVNWILVLVFGGVLLGVLLLRRVSFVPAEKARELLRQGARVVDVRTPGEFAAGHLPGAVSIPLGSLSDQLPRQAPDKNQPLLFHCLSGGRSGIARQQARRMGYTNVFNLGSYSRAQSILGSVQPGPNGSGAR